MSAGAFRVDNRTVLAIAVPMTLAFITTPLLGLVDTAVVGQRGIVAEMAGLAVGAILFDIVFTSLNFLRSGTTGLVAQAMGRGEEKEQTATLVRALALAVVLGLLCVVLADLILVGGLWFMETGPQVDAAVSTYFGIRILAAPLTLANYVVLGWAMGLARSGLGLGLQVVLNGTNIVLSITLGLWLGWGIEGVAWATVVAEAVALVGGLAAVLWIERAKARPSARRIWDGAAFLRLFALNRDIMIRSFCLLAAFFTFTAQGSDFGETVLAANAVLMNFFLIAGFFLDGMATAAEQLAGRAIGANYRPGFDRTVRLSIIWGVALGLAATLAFLLGGPALIDILTTNEAVRETARTYLPWAAATAIVGAVAFQMDGVFIGATWSRDMRDMMLVSFAIFAVTVWLAPIWLGNHGLWLALNVFLGIRGVTLWQRLPRRAEASFA